jgi:PucR family transcriptional regulator, purine catabolism regulatory protein
MAVPGVPAGGIRAEPAPGLAAVPESGGHSDAAQLRKLVAMCSHLSALAAHSTDLTPIVEVLASSTGSGVTVVNRGLQTLAFANVISASEIAGRLEPQAAESQLRAVLVTAARTRRALAVPSTERSGTSVIVAPISVGEEVVAHLLAVSSQHAEMPEDMRLLATEHAAMLCGIVLGRDLVASAAAGRARQQLVEGLILSRDPADPELARWGRHLGLDFAREHYVMVLGVPESPRGALVSVAEAVLARRAPDAVVAPRPDEIVAIVPVAPEGRSPAEQGRALALACVTSEGSRSRISGAGIGNPSASAAGVARSYTEARHALAAGSRMGKGGAVAAYSELGIHRLLLRVPNVSDLWAFAEEVLGALSEDERSTGIGYLKTLSVYFQENGSPRRAAERLHLHPNTVTYRLRRIEELTGISLSVHRDRLMAEIAAEILTGLEGRA